jgi:hypothetical protein
MTLPPASLTLVSSAVDMVDNGSLVTGLDETFVGPHDPDAADHSLLRVAAAIAAKGPNDAPRVIQKIGALRAPTFSLRNRT